MNTNIIMNTNTNPYIIYNQPNPGTNKHQYNTYHSYNQPSYNTSAQPIQQYHTAYNTNNNQFSVLDRPIDKTQYVTMNINMNMYPQYMNINMTPNVNT